MTRLNYYFKKYEKQITLKEIGFSGQKKIKNAKVLIVGMGGLGCPLLIYLANIGIQNIGIIYFKLKKYSIAKKYFENAIQKKIFSNNLFTQLALCQINLFDFVKSTKNLRISFEKLIEL